MNIMDSITTLIVEDEPMLAESWWIPLSSFPSSTSLALRINWKAQKSSPLSTPADPAG
jgi:hypothetical protein